MNSLLVGLLILGLGGAEIDLRNLPHRSNKVQISPKPWSGHTWACEEGQLWKWSDGPLQKFDLYRKSKNHEGSLAKSESKLSENCALAPDLQNAWALASVFSSEPKRPVRMILEDELVEFSIGDLKALLTYSFSASSDIWDRRQDSITAEQALSWVQEYHEKKHQIFWMDWKKGEEFWPVPVYASRYELTALAEKEDEIQLHLSLDFVEGISDWEEREEGETRDRSLDYFAILKGKREGDKFRVEESRWIQDPRANTPANSPDSFFGVSTMARGDELQKSRSPLFTKSLMDEILARSK